MCFIRNTKDNLPWILREQALAEAGSCQQGLGDSCTTTGLIPTWGAARSSGHDILRNTKQTVSLSMEGYGK